MRLAPLLYLLFVLKALPATAQEAPPGSPDPGQLCRAAVAVAEREAGLPPALLAAIARVESGRRDPATGAVHPWPWTINAEGRGSLFPTKAAAIAAVRQLQAQGVRSIDVGCMQVNLVHHPDAFPSLEAAFDPLTNARYAARFLTELQATRNDWMQSAGNYHSQTPDRAEGYRGLVAAAWAAERQGGPAALSPAMLAAMQSLAPGFQAAPGFMPALGGGGAMLGNRMDRSAVLPMAEGGRGRGLGAYRAAPIMLARRM
jgi:Transglycosylase SLT domain